MKNNFLYIPGETFPYDVLVSLGATVEEFLSHCERNFEYALTKEESSELEEQFRKETWGGKTIQLSNNAYLLLLREYPTTVQQFGFLAHEIFHTADLMLRKAGASLSDDSDEIWAYHLEWLTRRIYTHFGFFQLPKKKR